MDIATGHPEDHPTVLPLAEAGNPGVAPPTSIVPGQLHGPTYDGRDTTGEYQSFMSEQEAECRQAQSAGQAAENNRRAHYAGDILPLGAACGDPMSLPPVPANAVPAENSELYPFPGL